MRTRNSKILRFSAQESGHNKNSRTARSAAPPRSGRACVYRRQKRSAVLHNLLQERIELFEAYKVTSLRHHLEEGRSLLIATEERAESVS